MEEQKLERKYGLFTAIAMVVGIVIGSGVFFKAQTVLEKTKGNLSLGILAWLVGGFVMLFCIIAFSFMATKYEKVNGVVDYAEALVGKKYAYTVGWFMNCFYYPTLTSVLAWLSARYTMAFIKSAFPSFKLSGDVATCPEVIALSLLMLCISYAVNALSPKLAGKFQVSTTVIKLIPLSLMAVVGIIVGLTSDSKVLVENFAANTSVSGDTLFAAVVSTAFAYEGWIIATTINAEVRNAKKNLPIALISGGIIIIVVYTAYYLGVAGGASTDVLIKDGATVAFTNVFGKVFGTILNVFVAISCMGTMNGLMLGCTRGIYSLAARKEGPKPEMFSQIDKSTNMPSNSSIFGLLLCALWFYFFYVANLAPYNFFGFFGYDSSELPIITIYALYIPIFVMFMIKAKDLGAVKRFIIPLLAILGSIFMIVAAVYAHGIVPYNATKGTGSVRCPVVAYLIMFVIVMGIGLSLYKGKKDKE